MRRTLRVLDGVASAVTMPRQAEPGNHAARLFEPRATVKPVQFLLTDDIKERLRDLAHHQRRSMSEIAREALDTYLQHHDPDTS